MIDIHLLRVTILTKKKQTDERLQIIDRFVLNERRQIAVDQFLISVLYRHSFPYVWFSHASNKVTIAASKNPSECISSINSELFCKY
jgi:hypothetical protein